MSSLVSFMAPCDFHVMDVDTFNAECWGEVAGAVLSAITSAGVIHDIPETAARFLKYDGTAPFEFAFDTEDGRSIMVIYTPKSDENVTV